MESSFSSELLVATKNYRFPRCVIKPVGTIHGGGIVQIKPTSTGVDLRTLGLILNSRLIQYICSRYLTNHSQLTTCLNTGVIEELPIVLPEYPETYAILFDALSKLHNEESSQDRDICIRVMETVSEALVYDLYFGNSNRFQKDVTQIIETNRNQIGNISLLCDNLSSDSLVSQINDIMKKTIVEQIENRLKEIPTKSPRY